jgi:hypothetical protein
MGQDKNIKTLFKPWFWNSFVYDYEKMLTEILNLQFYSTGNKPKIIGLCTADFP